MIFLKRHYLVWINTNARMQIIDKLDDNNPIKLVIADESIPFIITRQTDPITSTVQVGICSWQYENDNRIRYSTTIKIKDIERILSPFDIVLQNNITNQFPELESILSLTQQYNVSLGMYGSSALELITKKEFRNKKSDYDLYLKTNQIDEIINFYNAFSQIDENLKKLVDAEVEYEGYGIKMKELFSNSKTVLGKGLYDVALFRKLGDQTVLRLERIEE